MSLPTCTKYFDCSTLGDDHLKCSNAESQDHITVYTKDIICILPDSKSLEDSFTLLFLQEESGTACSDALKHSTCLQSIHLRSLPPALSPYVYTGISHHFGYLKKDTEVHIVLSIASGTRSAKAIFSRILQPLLVHIGLTKYQLHETESASTVTRLCQSTFIPRSEAGVSQTIVLLSGDGGLNDIIDAFYTFHSATNTQFLPPNVALIPVGTGNAMASSIGLSSPPRACLTALLRGAPVPMSTFAARFSRGASYITEEGRSRAPITGGSMIPEKQPPTVYGGIVASWGIHAALVADSDTVEYRTFGSDRFKMAAKELLFPSNGGESHKYRGTITLSKRDEMEGNEFREVMGQSEHMYVLATLVSNLEKDFMISPESHPFDGSFRMIHFSPLAPQHATEILSSAYLQGQHVRDEAVLYTEIEGFRIDFHEKDERWRRICIDGKVIVVEEGGWMEVRKEQARLINIVSPK